MWGFIVSTVGLWENRIDSWLRFFSLTTHFTQKGSGILNGRQDTGKTGRFSLWPSQSSPEIHPGAVFRSLALLGPRHEVKHCWRALASHPTSPAFSSHRNSWPYCPLSPVPSLSLFLTPKQGTKYWNTTTQEETHGYSWHPSGAIFSCVPRWASWTRRTWGSWRPCLSLVTLEGRKGMKQQ